ncbi:AAA family ATPase [Arcanobacterium pluranimalium]|uniref:AAA family ATPase n=1 Tax=Arcanobacterium pluranimalium TaxID=108028 RepID=UPI001955FF3D
MNAHTTNDSAAAQTTAPAPAPAPNGELAQKFSALRAEIGKAVVGQEEAVSAILIALLADGHVLLEGVPGTAKTLLVKALSTALAFDNKRIQFTPDLMPGDLTGSLIYSSQSGEFIFRPGPVFTNILLADEVNRTPPKTQAALLEAMAEHQVTVDGEPRALPTPFTVVATQNPVEYEGTYSLPEAQLDRFLLKVVMPLPPRAVEVEMLNRHAHNFDPANIASAGIKAVASIDDVLAARKQVRAVEVHPAIIDYIVDLVRATRESPAINLGVSPRGATALLAVARAWAWLNGRMFVTPDDVKALAIPTLSHRIALHADAELDGLNAVQVVSTILNTVPVPR